VLDRVPRRSHTNHLEGKTMTEQRVLLAETAAKVFRDLPETGPLPGWDRVAESGLCGVMMSEQTGGFGGGWADALVVLRASALVALPVAETMIANRLLAAANLATDTQATSFAARATGELRQAEGFVFSGSLHGVPWGASSNRVVACVELGGKAHLLAVRTSDASAIANHRNMAGEPRDELSFANARVEAAPWPEHHKLIEMGALARTCQIAGALGAVLDMTIEHAKTRQQFGRAIGNFQAIQQQLAIFASESAAVGAAAAAACAAADRSAAGFEIAAAKLRANRAVDIATNVAHQVHGAIGITAEHALHRYTQRLWSWKSEFGNDRTWAMELGTAVAGRGADNLWGDMTGLRNDVRKAG
jgi:acyl-CoA dehydrogenase